MADRATSGRAGPRGTRWKAASAGIAQADGDDGTVRQLVLRAQRGDDLALGEIYIALFERVRRYMEVALEDLDGADDAAQQVFVKAFEALPRYRDTGVPFRSWVFRIAHNEAVDLLDRAKRESATDPATINALDDSLLVRASTLVADGELDGGIGDLVEQLPTPQRQALVLRFVYGMPAAEIAAILDTTPAAVRQAQHRGLRALAGQLEPAFLGDGRAVPSSRAPLLPPR